MNNVGVKQLLEDTSRELLWLVEYIDRDPFAPTVAFLNKYAIIKSSGTLETAYKTIVFEQIKKWCNTENLKHYLQKRTINTSSNPSYENICQMLKSFNKEWGEKFKQLVKSQDETKEIRDALKMLVEARNSFAHGGNPTHTIHITVDNYTKCMRIIEWMDQVCSTQ